MKFLFFSLLFLLFSMQYGRSKEQVLNLVVVDCQTDSDNDGLTDYEESFLCSTPSLFDANGMVAIRGKTVIKAYMPIL